MKALSASSLTKSSTFPFTSRNSAPGQSTYLWSEPTSAGLGLSVHEAECAADQIFAVGRRFLDLLQDVIEFPAIFLSATSSRVLITSTRIEPSRAA